MDPQRLGSVAVAITFRHDGHYPERNDARPANKTSWLQIGLSGQYQYAIPRAVEVGSSHAHYATKGEHNPILVGISRESVHSCSYPQTPAPMRAHWTSALR